MPWPPEKETNPKYEEQKCPEDSKNTLNSHFGCLFSASFGRDRVHTTMGQVGLGNPFNHGNTLGKLKNWCHKKSVVPWDSMLKCKNFVKLTCCTENIIYNSKVSVFHSLELASTLIWNQIHFDLIKLISRNFCLILLIAKYGNFYIVQSTFDLT